MEKIQFILTFEPVSKGKNGIWKQLLLDIFSPTILNPWSDYVLNSWDTKKSLLPPFFLLSSSSSLLSRFLRLWLCFVLFCLLLKSSTSIFLLSVVFKFVLFSEFVRLLFFVASLFLLPPLFMFVFVGEFVIMSVSSFVFWDVPLLDALFEIDGLLVFVIPGEVHNWQSIRHIVECWVSSQFWCLGLLSFLPPGRICVCVSWRICQRVRVCICICWCSAARCTICNGWVVGVGNT